MKLNISLWRNTRGEGAASTHYKWHSGTQVHRIINHAVTACFICPQVWGMTTTTATSTHVASLIKCHSSTYVCTYVRVSIFTAYWHCCRSTVYRNSMLEYFQNVHWRDLYDKKPNPQINYLGEGKKMNEYSIINLEKLGSLWLRLVKEDTRAGKDK